MGEPETFDHIVSLGYNCRTAYNLRRTFGFKTAYPFDWWVTPLPALAKFLREPSPDRLYDPAHLEPVIRDGGIYAIRNTYYDIQLDHEFPRGGGKWVRKNWRNHIEAPRARTEFLLRRFLELPPRSKVLFVRWTRKMESTLLGPSLQPLIDEVFQGLEQLFPAVKRSVLLVDTPVRPKVAGVINLRINDRGKDWKGTPELWTEGLRRLDVGLTGGPDPNLDLDLTFHEEIHQLQRPPRRSAGVG